MWTCEPFASVFTLCILWACLPFGASVMTSNCFTLFICFLCALLDIFLGGHYHIAVAVKGFCFLKSQMVWENHHVEACQPVALLPGLYTLRPLDALLTLTLKVSPAAGCLPGFKCDPKRFACTARSSENDSRWYIKNYYLRFQILLRFQIFVVR